MINRAKEIYKFIKDWFWALPVWKRAILTSIIGAFGGSSIIGFFNRYALYYHAVRQNFRVPVEGVEYLDLAVTLVSFAIIITSVLGTIAIYSLLNLIADVFTRLVVKSDNAKTLQRVKLMTMIVQLVTMTITFFGVVIERFFNKTSGEIIFDLSPQVGIILLIGVVFIVLGMVFSKSESGRKLFTLIVVFAGISIITISLFNQTIYKSFLKRIRYGGEIPIKIEYRKADNTQSETNGLLLIRTRNSITLRNIEKNEIQEIPNSRISKIIFQEE